jgi:hypothetical protein
MNLVNHRNERCNRKLANDLIRILKARIVRNGTAAMTGKNVGMRLEEDVRIRSLAADPRQQFEVRREAATANGYRPIIFDLAGHKDVAPLPGPSLDNCRCALVLADAGVNNQAPQRGRALDQRGTEIACLKEFFELAWAGRVEMRPQPVSNNRKGRHTVCSKAPGAQKTVFDLYQRHAAASEIICGNQRL